VAMPHGPTGEAEVTAEELAEVAPDELLAMPEGDHYEFVDGELVERTGSLLSSRVEITLGRLLDVHCVQNDLGWVLGPTCGYRCFPWKPRQVRRPDVSFIARGRLPAESQWSEGYV